MAVKIYTGGGDRGETDLPDGRRVSKDDRRIEACGALDELNAWLGLVCCESLPADATAALKSLQRRLLSAGAELAADGTDVAHSIGRGDVEGIEQAIDRLAASDSSPDEFLLPGGNRTAALLHVARTVCRRAERRVVSLSVAEPQSVSPALLAYVNRTSDLLFVLARVAQPPQP